MTAPKKAARVAPKLTAPELAAVQGAVDRCVLIQHLVPFHEALRAMNRSLDAILAKVEAKPQPRKRAAKAVTR